MSNSIELSQIGSFETGIFDESAAEISAFDATNQRLFVVNGDSNGIDVLDLADPTTPTLIDTIDVSLSGGPNSVAVANGIVAIALEDINESESGTVAFFDAASLDLLNLVSVGVLPDSLAFTPDGTKVLVANEGEPVGEGDLIEIDPEGSISIIDITDGVDEASVTAVDFTAFNGLEEELRSNGVRIFPGRTAAEDLEPEFIAISADSTTAFVTLQENNAIAVVDLETNAVVNILGLGLTDFSQEGFGLDASNEDGGINIQNEPVFGLSQPDSIATFDVDGDTFFVTANEGDGRDSFEDLTDIERIGDLELDPESFPNAEELQADSRLGRLEISTIDGDTDGDGDFDQLVAFGTRSFSIRDAEGNLIFDSGDDFEQITAELLPDNFNSNNDDNDSFDNRSDDGGPEPEGVVVGEVGDHTFAFIGLERIGGVIVYDITDPANSTFVQYINNRDFSVDVQLPDGSTNPAAGDLGPEGLVFISAEDSPTGVPLLTVSNEVSGSVSIFQIDPAEADDTVDDEVVDPGIGDDSTGDDEGFNDDGTFTLQLFHASDQEGGIDALVDAPNFSAVLDALRNEDIDGDGVAGFANTLTLSSGDAYIPSPFFAASDDVFGDVGRGDIMIQNALGFQAIAFGNHEFDLGTGEVEDLILPDEDDGFAGALFPYLSANIDFSTDDNLADLVVEDGQEASEIPNSIAGNTIITVGGEPIGVVGATTPTLESISSPGDVTINPLVFDSANPDDIAALAAEIQTSVDSLLAANPEINKVVLLAHFQQFSIEEQVSELLTDVDIIAAGGSNTILADETDRLRDGDEANGVYPILNTDADGNPIAIVNTDGNYRYVGRLVVDFDENGVIIPESIDPNISGAFATDEEGVATVGGTPNPEVVAVTDAIGASIIEQGGNIFGNTDVFLNGARSSIRTEETNFGNLAADANLEFAQSVDPEVTISIRNGGGIRDNIGEVVTPPGSTSAADVEFLPPQGNELTGAEVGEISQLDISNSLSFNNGLSLITVTAEELLALIENGVSKTEDGAEPGRFPQVSGIAFSFDADLPIGDRVISLATVDDEGNVTDVVVENGELVGEPSRTFRTVTLNFLADGGDDFPFPETERVDLEADEEATPTGLATFAPDGSEQDVLAEFLAENFSETPFAIADTPVAEDTRIQNLAFREDTVLSTTDLVGGDGSSPDSDAADNNPNDGGLVLPDAPTLFGTTESDVLEITGANGIVNTGAGNDLIDFTNSGGGNVLFAGEGRDFIVLGNNERVFANGGDDLIFAQTGGGNSINGNLGSDQFFIASAALPDSVNFINDFTSGEDVLGISGIGVGFDDLEITQTDAGALISANGNDLAVITNAPASFIASNPNHFVFA